MGTIADKLTYLNTTKTMLRNSLNKFGSNILTTDTFRSYDAKLNDIYDKLPKITTTGQGMTIYDVQNGYLDDFKMNGTDLYQNITTGKNLLPNDITTYTNQGIKFTKNSDGSITANGTSTAVSSANLIETSGLTLPAGTYTISGCPSGGSNSTYRIDINNGTDTSMRDYGSGGTFTLSEATTLTNVRIRFASEYTANSLTFYPMIEEGSTATDYEPYTGGIPSPNPDYLQDIKVVEGRQVITDSGKNTYDEEYELGYYNIPDGTKVYPQDSYGYRSTNLNELKPNTEYKISVNGELFENSIRLFYYDKNKTFLSTSSTSSGKFTTPNNCYYFAWHSSYLRQIFQDGIENLMFSDTIYSLDYEPYYEPVSYNIDLHGENYNYKLAKMPNTTYKNKIYRNNGNWYYEKNIEKIILDGYVNLFSSKKGNPGNVYAINQISNLKSTSSNDEVVNAISNYFIADAYSNLDNLDNGIVEYHDSHEIRFKFGVNSSITTLKLANEWLQNNNVLLYYALATPVTTQITNATLINQLEAISVHTGTNIFTISNDNNMIPELEITRLKELEKLS